MSKSDTKVSIETEEIKEYKKEINELELLLKADKAPIQALNWILKQLSLDSTNPLYIYFTENVLQRAMETILYRNDYAEIREIVATLKAVTVHCTQKVSTTSFAANVLLTIFDVGPTRPKFYVSFGKDNNRMYGFDEDPDPDRHIFLNNEWLLSRYLLSCVTIFIKDGGHQRVVERIHATNQNKEDPQRLSFAQFKIFVRLCERIHDLLLVSLGNPFIDSVVEESFGYFLRLSPEEMKTIEKKQINEIGQLLKGMLIRRHGSGSRIFYVILEKFQLNLAFNWLQLPFIQKRVAGLADINDFCHYFLVSSKDSKHIDQMALVDWIEEKKLVEYLFGESSHPELMKRCRPLLKFLAIQGRITEEHLDTMWGASIGKHESIIHEVWEIIGSIVDSLSLHYLGYIFDKIKTIPITSYDVHFLEFLERVTDQGVHLNIENKLSSESRKWYGIDILWEAIQKNSYPLTLGQSVIKSFYHMMGNYCCKDLREKFIGLCIENIKNKVAIINSQQILQFIIGTFSMKGEILNPNHVILGLNESHNLLDVLIENIVWFSEFTNSAVAEQQQQQQFQIDYNYFCFQENSHYYYQVKSSLDLLDFILRSSSLFIEKNHIEVFWTAVIEKSLTPQTRDLGLDWVKGGTRSKNNYPAFDDDVVNFIFSTKIPTLNFSTISLAGAALIDHLFKFLNAQSGNMEFYGSNDNFFVRNYVDFIGLEYIWRLAVEAQSNEVGVASVDLLTKIQQSVSVVLESQFSQIREEYINKCMKYLSDNANQYAENNTFSQLTVERCLLILKKFLDLFSSENTEKHGASISRGNLITVNIVFPNTENFKIELYDKETVGDLRQKVAKHSNLELTGFRLIQAKQQFDQDSKVLCDLPNLLKTPVFCIKTKIDPVHGPLPSPPKFQMTGISGFAILSDEVHFSQLFKLLNLPHPFCESIWEIIMQLPTNFHMKSVLVEISSEKANWNEILNPNNCFALYYCLQIVDSLVYIDEKMDSPEKKQEKISWHQRFVESQGLKHIFSIFQNTDFLQVNFGSKRYVCFALLLRILSLFLFEKDENGVQKLNMTVLSTLGVDQKIITSKLVDLIKSISSDINMLSNSDDKNLPQPINSGKKNTENEDNIQI